MINFKNFALIVVVLGIVILIGGVLPYLQSKNQPSLNENQTQSDHQLEYTNKGFTPETLEIKLGDTVSWVNRSDKPMWVASDQHPSHQDLPGFDQKGIESQNTGLKFIPSANAHHGGVYQYTFTKSGSWKYHNHLVPADKGIIIVRDN